MPPPGKYDLHNEKALVLGVAQGDTLAFEQLFRTHWDAVFSFAFLMMKNADLADDIAQDVFLDFWKEREKMDVVENVKGFLLNSVKFAVHKRLRRMKVEEAYKNYQAGRIDLSAGGDGNLQLKELQETLREGISRLPPQQQRAFRLSREQGLSHEEISAEMGVSRKTVKDYIVRSIAFLRLYLGQYGDISIYLLLLWYSKK